jgi:hypothetical protein
MVDLIDLALIDDDDAVLDAAANYLTARASRPPASTLQKVFNGP